MGLGGLEPLTSPLSRSGPSQYVCRHRLVLGLYATSQHEDLVVALALAEMSRRQKGGNWTTKTLTLRSVSLLFAIELATRGAERHDCVYIGSPGNLASSWEMAFYARVRKPGKVRMTA